MANGKTRLELTWIGKEDRQRLEPRILIEEPQRSYHAARRVSEHDRFDNRLIFGDNLLALKALESEWSGRVNCIYIDPPFNTGSAFKHYDDGVEHSLWLGMMRDRLDILARLIAPEGSIWITIDDHEGHYLKVLCDEVLGRRSFVATVVWENFYGRSNTAALSPAHNYLLVYSPLGADWKRVRRLLPRSEKSRRKYSNPDNDPRGPWRLGPVFAAEERHEGLMYTVVTPGGRSVRPPAGSHWRMPEAEFWALVAEGRISFGQNGANVPALKLFLHEVQQGVVPRTWWPHTETGHSQEAKREAQALAEGVAPFDTPKPERLLSRVIEISTKPGEIVLDSFAGSGTTGAVAHKMGRRWIMVELGEHCHTHIIPRLRKVIDGEDPGGVTEQTGWKGGGGFRYYRLAPSLLERDGFGNWVISKQYNKEMLAEAVCKLHGFRYEPSPEVWWQHGRSSERDFLYVTTQTLTAAQLQHLGEEVGPDRTLLVCCGAFRGRPPANLTVEKIPKSVLDRCEWGRDDYSLRIASLPPLEPAAAEEPAPGAGDAGTPGGSRTGTRRRSPSARTPGEPTLFDLAPEPQGD